MIDPELVARYRESSARKDAKLEVIKLLMAELYTIMYELETLEQHYPGIEKEGYPEWLQKDM